MARSDIDRIGVDVPFGWPDAFVALMKSESSVESWQEKGSRKLRLRETDIHWADSKLNLTPISVTMDRIAAPAMRWRLLTRKDGVPRNANEVYPAAALKLWQLPSQGYKQPGQRNVRNEIVDKLGGELRLAKSDHIELMRKQADALDAFVAALVARAVALGCTQSPPIEMAEAAAREGWIHVPSCSLQTLLDAKLG
jgi:predicted nuclease with RNAse H fold